MKLLDDVLHDYRYLVTAALVAALFYTSFHWLFAVPLPVRRAAAELRQLEAV